MKGLLGLALILLARAPAGAAGEPSPVTLRGRVVDAQTGEPIAKALVSIQASKTFAVTDARGRFVLGDVAQGETELSVTTVGYGVEKGSSRPGWRRRARDRLEPGSPPTLTLEGPLGAAKRTS